jgi:hypothetical protein
MDTTALCDTDIRTPLANLAQAHWVKTTQINENAIINSFCQALRVKGKHIPAALFTRSLTEPCLQTLPFASLPSS